MGFGWEQLLESADIMFSDNFNGPEFVQIIRDARPDLILIRANQSSL